MTDTRNIVDRFRGWETDLIKDHLNQTAFPYAVLMEQFQGDFNIATVIRNANAFGAKEVSYIGKKKYDRRGTCGSHHYSQVNHLSSYEELLKLKEKYVFIGVDCIPGSVSMEDFQWPDNPLLIFGEESSGLTKETIELCDSVVAIKQYGSVRSINAGCASSVAMYDLVNKKFAKKS